MEGLRQHPLPNGGLEVGQHADEQGHGDACARGRSGRGCLPADRRGGGGGHADGLGRIILPVTPPEEFTATAVLGAYPHGLRGGALHTTAEKGVRRGAGPVRNTPSQPRIRAKSGNRLPVLVEADAEGRASYRSSSEKWKTEDGGDGQDGKRSW